MKFAAVQQGFKTRWAGLAVRERRLVAAAAVVVGLSLVWGVAIQPARQVLKSAPARIAELERQVSEMEALAEEARSLAAAAPVSLDHAKQALQGQTARLGAGALLTFQGDSALLTVQGVSGRDLWSWLDDARHVARARPVEVDVRREFQSYSGRVVVSLQGLQ